MFNDGDQAAQYPAERGNKSSATLSGLFEGEFAAAAFCAVIDGIGEIANAKR